MRIHLSREYVARYGIPKVRYVASAIFRKTSSSSCNGCGARCCEWGANIEQYSLDNIFKFRNELEFIVGLPYAKWLEKTWHKDKDNPGGGFWRIKAYNWRCVFLSKDNRCILHSLALDKGIDYHELKPLSCWLLPVSFHNGFLHQSYHHVLYHTEPHPYHIICKGDTSIYHNARKDLAYLFGDELITELDIVVKEYKTSAAGKINTKSTKE